MHTIRVVFISIPRDEATEMARALVTERLCACVNIVPKIESFFWWDNEIHHDDEALLLVKTTADKFDMLKAYVLENHPYDVPEIISMALTEGYPEYLAWVKRVVDAG